jgi:hypothetical protein
LPWIDYVTEWRFTGHQFATGFGARRIWLCIRHELQQKLAQFSIGKLAYGFLARGQFHG